MAIDRGHIRERTTDTGKTRFDAILSVHGDGRSQKRRQVSKTFDTRREAERWLIDQIGKRDRADFVEPHRLTVEQWFEEHWLPSAESRLDPVTVKSYQRIVRNQIVPHVGHVRLQQLNAAQVDACYRALEAQGLSRRTVRYTHQILKKAMKDALRKRLVSRNVVDDADPPKVPSISRGAEKAWTSGELVAKFLDHVCEDRLFAAYRLLFLSGMRNGEVCGLAWDSVDLDGGVLHVRQVVKNLPGELVMGTPKTDKSRRSISLDAGTVSALRSHRREQLQERMAIGPGWNPQNLVFVRETGEPMHPSYLTGAFRRHVKAAGVPKLSVHGARHTHATLLVNGGENPKTVAERLGHSDVSLTLNVYTRHDHDVDRAAANRIADAIDA